LVWITCYTYILNLVITFTIWAFIDAFFIIQILIIIAATFAIFQSLISWAGFYFFKISWKVKCNPSDKNYKNCQYQTLFLINYKNTLILFNYLLIPFWIVEFISVDPVCIIWWVLAKRNWWAWLLLLILIFCRIFYPSLLSLRFIFDFLQFIFDCIYFFFDWTVCQLNFVCLFSWPWTLVTGIASNVN